MDFEELYIHFINEENTRHYTLECNRDMELIKAVEKLAKLEKVHVESILLFNFDIKMSINSNIKSCDVKSFIPDRLKVFEIADSKQKEHTILFRNRTLITRSFLNKIDKVMEGGNISNSANSGSSRNSSNELKVETGTESVGDVKNKENFNGINKLEAKQLSRSMDMEEVCPN